MKKKLLSVVTYHVYSPVPRQAMQRGGTAATSCVSWAHCQEGMPQEAQLMFALLHRWALPFLPRCTLQSLHRVCCRVELNHDVPQPSLSSTVLLQCPSAGELLSPSPLDISTRVNFAALNPFATGTKTPDMFLKLQFRNHQQQQGKDCSPAVKVANEKIKIHNWYNNEVLQYRWISFHFSLQPWLVLCQCLQSFKRGS